MMDAVFAARAGASEIYAITGIQFLPFNTLFQLFAACRATPKLIDARVDARDDSRSAELLADRPAAVRVHHRDDDAVRRRANADRGRRGCSTQLGSADAAAAAARRAGHASSASSAPTLRGALAGTPVVAPACHDTGSAVASVAGGGTRAFLSSGTWSLLGTELPAPIITPALARAELHERRRRRAARPGC